MKILLSFKLTGLHSCLWFESLYFAFLIRILLWNHRFVIRIWKICLVFQSYIFFCCTLLVFISLKKKFIYSVCSVSFVRGSSYSFHSIYFPPSNDFYKSFSTWRIFHLKKSKHLDHNILFTGSLNDKSCFNERIWICDLNQYFSEKFVFVIRIFFYVWIFGFTNMFWFLFFLIPPINSFIELLGEIVEFHILYHIQIVKKILIIFAVFSGLSK